MENSNNTYSLFIFISMKCQNYMYLPLIMIIKTFGKFDGNFCLNGVLVQVIVYVNIDLGCYKTDSFFSVM